MREKQRKERSKASLPLLTYRAEEILVAKNRALSPLVLSFVYEPENIALKDLGTLFGTFIIDDHHEDSSYIVNCLAAAAKKEYFINPRRSVEESFESTLHKINLTLGKLVRDGHINWMGKLHGSIIAIHDREAYFSVTGAATILLLRHATLSAISEGLADTEAASHPLKTFTEIAEGQILADDKIIVSTPELLELLPHALLEREAEKLPFDRFAQLLRTALVNERSAAATILIDFSESPATDTRGALRMMPKNDIEKDDAPISPLIENIFSSQTFHKERKSPPIEKNAPTATDAKEKEHIDNRTGHIYIQADTAPLETDTETAIDRGFTMLRERSSILAIKSKKHISKYSALLSETALQCLSKCSRSLIQVIRLLAARLFRYARIAIDWISSAFQHLFSRKASFANISFTKRDALPSMQSPSLCMPSSPAPETASFHTTEKLPSRLIASILASAQCLRLAATRISEYRPARRNWLIGIIGSLALIGTSFMIFSSESEKIPKDEPSVTALSPIEPPFPPMDEPLARETSGSEILSFGPDETTPTPIVLKDTLFILTDQSIINGETKVSLPLPTSVSPILLASAMRDLNAIFLYGTDKRIYIYYPNAKSLAENAFPLPDDFTLTDMSTYLTYLYAFDATAGRILRFPRAEGGFGAPTEWLKDKIAFKANAKITIGENILISSNDSVFSFTKGKGGELPLTGTTTPVVIQDIALAGDGSFIILDATARRIVHFEKDGRLIGQIFDRQLRNASHLAALSNGSTVFVTTQDKILSFELQ